MIVRADLHVHSAASWDGRSDLAALAQAAHACGLDAIAVCDHDLCTDVSGEFPVLLIPGVEITSTAGHILGLFLEKPLDRALWETGAPTPQAAIDAIRACGGLAAPAHPFSPQKLDETALEALCPDGIEVQNARVALKNAARNRQAQEFAAQHHLAVTGGSDAHSAAEVGGCYTELDCAECSLSALRDALAAGRTRAVFDHACTWTQKGLSQWRGARRAPILRRCRALAYLCVCVLRDMFNRR